MPWEGFRVMLAERFGWTLEYIDSLSEKDFVSILAVLDGRAKASNK